MTIHSRPLASRRATLPAALGLLLLLQGCCDPRIVTNYIPDGCVGDRYAFNLIGACTDNRWAVVSGDLPPGIELSTRGLLSGLPTLAGTFLFTVTVSPDFNPASKGFSMEIHEADSPECLEEVDGGVVSP